MFHHTPPIVPETKNQACFLAAKCNIKYKCLNEGEPDEENLYYFLPDMDPNTKAVKNIEIKEYALKMDNPDFETFDDYVAWTKKLFIVSLNRRDWFASTCTCDAFKKNYICSHLIAAAIHGGLIQPEEEEMPETPLYKPRKRGRPKTAKRGEALKIN